MFADKHEIPRFVYGIPVLPGFTRIYENSTHTNDIKPKAFIQCSVCVFDGRRTKQTNEPSVLVEHRALLNSDPEHPIGSAASEPGEETLNLI